MYKLQDINLNPIIGNELIRDMYWRSNTSTLVNEEGNIILIKKTSYDLFTYYNSLSVEKWKRYTYANKFYLVLKISGKFNIGLFGHYVENDVIKKEWLGKYTYSLCEPKELIIQFPDNMKSQVVSFYLETKSKVILQDSYYAVDLEKEYENNPYISLVTTTFKKEDYIKKNIELLRKDIFDNEDYSEHFCWNIIDNGRTLGEENDGHIRIIPNKNLGGAGGFARGMVESLQQNKRPTHILLMDDDVNVSSESFKRLYKLLNILRPEYKDYFISGAMINMDAPNIQHENTGTLRKGFCEPLHSGRNLSLWDQVILNEQIDDSINYKYAAWWFCCIPSTIARLDNLPLPVFVRGDDMEYSIRNHAKFITMNGISIWHMGFGGKYNAVMECYQAKRNELIVFSTREELDVDTSFKKVEELFWQNMYKFDYVSAGFLADAVEDYLKGPKWFSGRNLFEEISNRRKMDNTKKDVTDNIRKMIDYPTLFEYKQAKGIKKFIYDYTYNGQARIPNFICKGGVGIIPYNGAYYPEKQMLTAVNYGIDTINDKYVVLRKNRNEFKKLKNRWLLLKKEYAENKNNLEEKYQEYSNEITNDKYWNNIFE